MTDNKCLIFSKPVPISHQSSFGKLTAKDLKEAITNAKHCNVNRYLQDLDAGPS